MRRVPAAVVPDTKTGALSERSQTELHLGPRRKVRGAIHDAGHDRTVRFFVRQKAVPVVSLVGRGATLRLGVRLGPAEHSLEDGPAPEHAARLRVVRDHGMIDAETAQRVRQLKSPRAAADDDERIPTGRKRPLCQLNHLVVARTFRASPWRSRNITRGCPTRNGSSSAPGSTRHRRPSCATMSDTGGTPRRHEISPK